MRCVSRSIVPATTSVVNGDMDLSRRCPVEGLASGFLMGGVPPVDAPAGAQIKSNRKAMWPRSSSGPGAFRLVRGQGPPREGGVPVDKLGGLHGLSQCATQLVRAGEWIPTEAA